MIREKRSFSRVAYCNEANLQQGGGESTCRIGDLSLRGMFVSTSAPMAEGERVEVEFSLAGCDDEMPVRCPGRVARVSDGGAGIEFGDMDMESFIRIRRIVNANTGDPDRVADEFARWLARNWDEPR